MGDGPAAVGVQAGALIGGPAPIHSLTSGRPRSSRFWRPTIDGVLKRRPVAELLRRFRTSRFGGPACGRCSAACATGARCTGRPEECIFQQVHPPGREAAIDFTHATELGVTIAGEPFAHLLFEFVLSYSQWTLGGSWPSARRFEALVPAAQGALWALGGVPEILRSDNLSAATHELRRSGGRDLTERFRGRPRPLRRCARRGSPGRVARKRRRRASASTGSNRWSPRPCSCAGSRDFDERAAVRGLRPGGRRATQRHRRPLAWPRSGRRSGRSRRHAIPDLHHLPPDRATLEHDSRRRIGPTRCRRG